MKKEPKVKYAHFWQDIFATSFIEQKHTGSGQLKFFVGLYREVNIPKESDQLDKDYTIGQWHKVKIDQLSFLCVFFLVKFENCIVTTRYTIDVNS